MALVEEEKGGCGEESVSSGVEAGEEDPLNSSSDAEIGRDCSSVSALMETPSLLLCDDLSGSGEGKGTKLLKTKRRPKIISSSTPVLDANHKAGGTMGPVHISTPNCSKIMSRSHLSSGYLRGHSRSKLVHSGEIHPETLSVGPETSWELPDNCNPLMNESRQQRLPFKCVRKYSFTNGTQRKKQKSTDKPKMNVTF